MYHFLVVKTFYPNLKIYFSVLTISYIVAFILAILNYFSISFILIEAIATIVSIFMLVVAIKIYQKGYRPAGFFLLAWSIFLIGVTVYVLKDLGILPFNTITNNTMLVGSSIEVVVLSLALADRINILKKEKELSQASTLKILQENEKLILEQKTLLEKTVLERTLELSNNNQKLEEALNNLKDTQSHLVNAEKMATLGQLTAGIAHEINNPINFVSASIKPLKLDLLDVFEIVKKYEANHELFKSNKEMIDIENFKKEIDFDYIKIEMESLLVGIEDGANRTAEIVKGLKNFSRLDESEIKEVNINEGVESTLVLIRSTVPKNTIVITNLGDIPVIECMAGKLNQVFLNLFTNAIYAISANDKVSNTLTVSTFHKGENVILEIKDTGIGMSEATIKRIFEPFFTTKEVGKGTGLGMSIVLKIIEAHGAKINVESEIGIGTKISIILNKFIKK
jgi:signal transduction histidine kinase